MKKARIFHFLRHIVYKKNGWDRTIKSGILNWGIKRQMWRPDWGNTPEVRKIGNEAIKISQKKWKMDTKVLIPRVIGLRERQKEREMGKLFEDMCRMN